MPSFKGAALILFALNGLVMASPVPGSELEKRTLKTCPDLDGSTYTGPGGTQYKIRCNMDTTDGGYLDLLQTANFELCMQRCGSRADCRWATFDGPVNSGGNCYLKHSSGGDNPQQGIKRALKLD